jgi:endo-1,4-beta-xylanase
MERRVAAGAGRRKRPLVPRARPEHARPQPAPAQYRRTRLALAELHSLAKSGDAAGYAAAWRRLTEAKLIACAGRFTDWDVVNHAGREEPAKEIAPLSLQAEAMAMARRLDPGARRAVNENLILDGGDDDRTTRRARYLTKIRALAEAGQAPDLVGFMSHFVGTYTGIDTLQRVLDECAATGARLQVTEYDIVGNDEELNGRYTRDFLTLCFSHPAMDAILLWGFWDGAHWKGDSPVFRADWSLKPSGQAWLDLVHQRWWTSAALTADPAGQARLRAFLGRHRITVTTADGRRAEVEVALEANGADFTVTVP